MRTRAPAGIRRAIAWMLWRPASAGLLSLPLPFRGYGSLRLLATVRRGFPVGLGPSGAALARPEHASASADAADCGVRGRYRLFVAGFSPMADCFFALRRRSDWPMGLAAGGLMAGPSGGEGLPMGCRASFRDRFLTGSRKDSDGSGVPACLRLDGTGRGRGARCDGLRCFLRAISDGAAAAFRRGRFPIMPHALRGRAPLRIDPRHRLARGAL